MTEILPPRRKYLTKWEKTWPWLSKAPGEEERAYCVWCKAELGLYTSRFSAHEGSLLHQRNAEYVSQGVQIQELDSKKREHGEEDLKLKKKRKKNENKTIFSSEPTFFDLPQEQDILDGTNIQPLSTAESAETLEATIIPADTNLAPGSTLPLIDMALLDTGELLKGVQVKVLHEAEDSLQFSNFKMELPVIPMCTLKANAQHPSWYQEHLTYALSTGQGYDAVWICDGGLYRVHKFVLAAFSQELKGYMPDSEADAVIYTPDLNSDMVKSILCLIYTGESLITWRNLNEINVALKMIGLCGQDLTAVPNNITNIEALAISYSSTEDKLSKKEFTPIKLMPLATALSTNCKLTPDQWATLNSLLKRKEGGSLLTPGELENPGMLFDNIETWDHHPVSKIEPAENLVKIELEDYVSGDEENIEPNMYRGRPIKVEDIKNEMVKSSNLSGKQMKKDLDILSNKAVVTSDNEVVRLADKNFASLGWTRLDMRETRTCYPVYTKGDRSKQLPFDLFDDSSVAASVKLISVCPICFKLFDDKEKMRDHKVLKHNVDIKGKPGWNNMVLGKHKFKCNKCESELDLKHLVWFVKHYKFCGIDDEKANDVMKEDDTEECSIKALPPDISDLTKMRKRAKRAKNEDVMEVLDIPRRKAMSRALLGKEVTSIWGCRRCYKAFEDEPSFRRHINTEHDGTIEHGTCYDPEIKKYCCPRCKVYKTEKSVHVFMYHLANCYVNQQGSVPIDDEDDIDQDTNDDYVDPWGVVNKPLKIQSFRSKWICEAFFGQLYNTLFPCHLCYNVFRSEEELRDHFRSTHPGLQNFLEDGDHYDKDNKVFRCPYCKRDVCKNQRNSIFFTYHMRKCNKELHEVTRSCPTCHKSFNVFRTLQYHIQTKCGTATSICHICGLKVKTAVALQKHVMITHSDARPYACKVCSKAFKRPFDLEYHMKLHMGSLDWSCEKCGKSFPLKKNLRTHMKIHLTDNEKPHVCHICGNRFMRKSFLANHLTTHSSFRGFACEVCNSQVKTKDSLKQHRRKVHKLSTPIPDECILRPDPTQVELKPNILRSDRGGGKRRRRQPGQFQDILSGVRIKEEVLPVLGEELELS